MWRNACVILGVCLALGMTTRALGQSMEDERAIRQLAQQYETGWNTHDMELLGRMRTDDIDFVVVTGEHRKGREAAMAQLAEQHRTQFRDNTWANEQVSVQFLRPDITLVHIEWAIQGDCDPDDTPPAERHLYLGGDKRGRGMAVEGRPQHEQALRLAQWSRLPHQRRPRDRCPLAVPNARLRARFAAVAGASRQYVGPLLKCKSQYLI